MAKRKRKRTKNKQTMVNIWLYRKLKIEQQEPYYKTRVNSGVPEGSVFICINLIMMLLIIAFWSMVAKECFQTLLTLFCCRRDQKKWSKSDLLITNLSLRTMIMMDTKWLTKMAHLTLWIWWRKKKSSDNGC
jgi:hypothetical protein